MKEDMTINLETSIDLIKDILAIPDYIFNLKQGRQLVILLLESIVGVLNSEIYRVRGGG